MTDFEAMASVLQGVPEHVLEGVFINGSRPEIRAEVRLIMPRRLEELMEYAQRVEDCNWTRWALASPILGPHMESLRSGFLDLGLAKKSPKSIIKNNGNFGSWAPISMDSRPNSKLGWGPNNPPHKYPTSSNPLLALNHNPQLPSFQNKL